MATLIYQEPTKKRPYRAKVNKIAASNDMLYIPKTKNVRRKKEATRIVVELKAGNLLPLLNTTHNNTRPHNIILSLDIL